MNVECPKCKIPLRPGAALVQRLRPGRNCFYSKTEAKLEPCLKCPQCGFSLSVDQEAPTYPTTVGFSRFFLQSVDIPGWTDAHLEALSVWLSGAVGFDGGVRIPAVASMRESISEPGYRKGVVLLPFDPEGLPSPLKSRIVRVDETTEFVTVCKSRVPGETPRKKTMALVDRLPDARFITLVLYHKDVLHEDNDRSTNCDWEVVAILAQMDEDEPMNPSTLMANHFKADGGTATLMTPEVFEAELRKSYNYWKGRSMGVTRSEVNA